MTGTVWHGKTAVEIIEDMKQMIESIPIGTPSVPEHFYLPDEDAGRVGIDLSQGEPVGCGWRKYPRGTE